MDATPTEAPGPPPAPRSAETFAEAEDALLSRWPESRLEPSLDRIAAFCELLGDPQTAFRVIHLTGTNGKTSTARMIDALLRALELRTGRFTSPHVERMNERISIDGEPLSDEDFVRAFNDVAPLTHLVDEQEAHPLSFFEAVVGMAYAAFADAPVDVAVVEVGMGGSWDATSVAHGDVAVIGPVALDHAQYLGDDPAAIAVEKAGIIREGATAVVAQQEPEVMQVVLDRIAEVGATPAREGLEFGVVSRTPAVGGQLVSLQGLRARYDDLFLPLYGAHQAQNAALALAAVESFVGGDQPLGDDVVRAAFEEASSPGRLEIVRTSPTILLDAAHNPAGARATAEAVEDSFAVDPRHRRDRRAARQGRRGPPARVRAAADPPGGHPAARRARPARGAAGRDGRRDLRRGAGDRAAAAGRRAGPRRRPGGGGGHGVVVVLRRRAGHRLGGHGGRGPVAAGAEDRVNEDGGQDPQAAVRAGRPERSPRRGMCAAVLSLEAITVALSTPVMVAVGGVAVGPALVSGLGVAVACLVVAGMLRSAAGYVAGWAVQVGAIALGLLVPPMFFLGAVFAALWATADLLGRKIERERAAAYDAYEAARGEDGPDGAGSAAEEPR